MTEAMPFLRKVNITFLCPPDLKAGAFFICRFGAPSSRFYRECQIALAEDRLKGRAQKTQRRQKIAPISPVTVRAMR